MGEPPQRSDKHSQRLDDELVRDPSDEEARTGSGFWEAPGHDGVIGKNETDADRTDLRAEIGEYVSLVKFPTSAKDLVKAAEDRDAPDEVLAQLRRLKPTSKYANTAELWSALNLRSEPRF